MVPEFPNIMVYVSLVYLYNTGVTVSDWNINSLNIPETEASIQDDSTLVSPVNTDRCPCLTSEQSSAQFRTALLTSSNYYEYQCQWLLE